MILAAVGLTLFVVFSPHALGWSPPDPQKTINKFLFNFFGKAAYVGVFAVLIACGLGVPLPEDVPLITGGYLAALGPPRGVSSVWIMMIVGLLGILVGDSIIFKAGHDYGESLLDTRVGKHITRERVAQIRDLMAKHGPKLIMVARFIPGLRAATYFVAGTSKVRYAVFLTYDGLAALVSAPMWVYLGYWAGKKHALNRAYQMAKQFQLVLLGTLIVAGLGLLGWWWFKRRARLAAAKTAPPPAIAQGSVPVTLPQPKVQG